MNVYEMPAVSVSSWTTPVVRASPPGTKAPLTELPTCDQAVLARVPASDAAAAPTSCTNVSAIGLYFAAERVAMDTTGRAPCDTTTVVVAVSLRLSFSTSTEKTYSPAEIVFAGTRAIAFVALGEKARAVVPSFSTHAVSSVLLRHVQAKDHGVAMSSGSTLSPASSTSAWSVPDIRSLPPSILAVIGCCKTSTVTDAVLLLFGFEVSATKHWNSYDSVALSCSGAMRRMRGLVVANEPAYLPVVSDQT